MKALNTTKNLTNEIKRVIFSNDYILFLLENNNKTVAQSSSFILPENKIDVSAKSWNQKSFFSSFTEKFSIKYHLEKKNIANFNKTMEVPVQNAENFSAQYPNDPIIDLEYINSLFDGAKLDDLLTQISIQYLGTKDQDLILQQYKKHLVDMFNALNGDKINVAFIENSFKDMYSLNSHYNGQLRGQKIRHDILMFQQAFKKNPEKFKDLEELIPVNLGTSIDVYGIAEPKIICHSIGGKITEDSLKYAHEILISRATSAKYNIKLFVKLDQNDDEVMSVLKFFSKVGGQFQDNTDVSFIDEDNMTFSEWGIKNEYFKLQVSRKFTQQIIQVGNFVDESSKESFEEKYILELLRDLDKKIRSPVASLEQKAILIKRHNELVAYFFSRDPVLIVPTATKQYFSSVKIFIDISSYQQK